MSVPKKNVFEYDGEEFNKKLDEIFSNTDKKELKQILIECGLETKERNTIDKKEEQKNEYVTYIWYYQRNGANEEFGIGEYAYGITMIPCEWVYEYLSDYKRVLKENELLRQQNISYKNNIHNLKEVRNK